MATHTLSVDDVILNLRWAATDIRRHHSTFTPSVRDVLLTIEGLADLLEAGDDVVFESDAVEECPHCHAQQVGIGSHCGNCHRPMDESEET